MRDREAPRTDNERQQSNCAKPQQPLRGPSVEHRRVEQVDEYKTDHQDERAQGGDGQLLLQSPGLERNKNPANEQAQ